MSKEISWGIIHGDGTIECHCDNCNKEHPYDFEDGDIDFAVCQEELKDFGWKSRKIDGKWYDFCSEKCLKEFMSKR